MKNINIRSIIQYKNCIRKEKKVFAKYDLINTGKMPHENYNVKYAPNMRNDSYSLILLNLICGLDSTNLHLLEAYQLWETIRFGNTATNMFNTFTFERYYKLCAYIVHDMKYFVDMMISLIVFIQNPESAHLSISSIGDYLNPKDQILDLEAHEPFLTFLNDLENSYKHSFPNYHASMIIGTEAPCVASFYAKYNKNIVKPVFKLIPIKELVHGFNELYKTIFDLLNRL